MNKQTRGERNNNPGNIRESPGDRTQWIGERATDDDKALEEFKTPQDGIRALCKVVLNYQRKHGLNTVREIIGRWAPPNENNTGAYVRAVADAMDVQPDDAIDMESAVVLTALVRAIIQHENGRIAYTPEVIEEGVDRALA